MKQNNLQAGAAQVDITPQTDISLAGEVGWFRPGQFVLDPLYAKAIVFEQNGRKCCIVALDLTIVTGEWSSRIREAAAKRFGFSLEGVMVHATQVHAAPALGTFMFDKDFPPVPDSMGFLRGGDPNYPPFVFERIMEAIRNAHDNLQPVRIRSGSGIEGRVQFNRRGIKSDGRVQMPGPRWSNPLGPTYIRYIEGPIDPELGVISIQGESPEVLALILNYTGHPVNVFPDPLISADWPGAWAAEMRSRFGPDCVALVLNGCCGNINPWDPYDPDYEPDHRRMGRILGDTTWKVLQTLDVDREPCLQWRARTVPIPIREVEKDLLKESRKMLEEHPEPIWNDQAAYAAYEGAPEIGAGTRVVDSKWMKAASVMSVYLQKEREKNLDYEIQAFRVGQTAVVGLPGEPFVEGQLRIKMGSPAFRTYVAHCCNMYCGYVPIKEAFGRGGHEAETRYWSKLVPAALDMVVLNSVEILKELF